MKINKRIAFAVTSAIISVVALFGGSYLIVEVIDKRDWLFVPVFFFSLMLTIFGLVWLALSVIQLIDGD